MTTTTTNGDVKFSAPLAFDLPPALEATEPPELTLGRRDAVRLMVSRGTDAPVHTHAYDLARYLDPGDLVVLNTSATVPAAVDAIDHGTYRVVHFSTEMPDSSFTPRDTWLVEVRTPVDGAATQPNFDDFTGHQLSLPGGAVVELRERFTGSIRLWVATVDTGGPVVDYLEQWGRPIRYRYVPATWPIDAYRNVYANEPGSAEMPSAGRPVTRDVLASLEARGVGIATLLLHTGVASLEANELPYPERFRVSRRTARRVNDTHAAGHRVVAVGTTVVRALESATGTDGITHPAAGWTDVVITPERGVHAVDGLLTGWHAPEATHLQMLEAVAGRRALEIAYPAAVEAGYHWHEFGDSHLLLPERRS
jgi:S-adenosylmethionine:tRNA ribosyltransferase-isomerase